MMYLNDSKSFVALYDYQFNLIKLIDIKNLSVNLSENESILKIIYSGNLNKFLDFSMQLKQNKSVFAQEISIIELDEKITVLYFVAIDIDDKYIVTAFSNYFELYEDLVKINNQQTNLLRETMKKMVPFIDDYGNLSSLNNELINAKRELLKKNCEVYELLESENQLNKRLEELITTKNMILSVIAHDLRTPLANIIQVLQYIEKPEDYKELFEEGIFKNLTCSTKYTLNLLDDLLEWAKCESENYKMLSKTEALDKIVDETVSFLKNIAYEKNIDLSISYDCKPIIFGDKRLISIVLRNLITNAVKFTNDGGQIAIKVSQMKDFAIVYVIDSGVGMAEDVLDHLFNFSKCIKKQGTRGEKGSGFGLLLCKTFAKKNGGDIFVESQLNQGSQFSFTIPLNIT